MTKSAEQRPASLKLTDTQLIVLSRAAQRDDGAATLPEGITDRAATKLGATLIDKKVVREVKAKAGKPVWRRSEEEGPFALILTKLGRESIGAGDEGNAEDVEDNVTTSVPEQAPSSTSQVSIPRPGSKLAEVIALLDREAGASIAEMISATGWLPHTARAALTGLRKRGYAIERQRIEEGCSVYRIVAGSPRAQAA